MELALAAVVVTVALGFVIYPLLRPHPEDGGAATPVSDDESLAARRQAAYEEVLELEFDRRVGKLDQADYRELAEACLARAAALLAEADARDAALDQRAEREIAAMRESLRRIEPNHPGDVEARR